MFGERKIEISKVFFKRQKVWITMILISRQMVDYWIYLRLPFPSKIWQCHAMLYVSFFKKGRKLGVFSFLFESNRLPFVNNFFECAIPVKVFSFLKKKKFQSSLTKWDTNTTCVAQLDTSANLSFDWATFKLWFEFQTNIYTTPEYSNQTDSLDSRYVH